MFSWKRGLFPPQTPVIGADKAAHCFRVFAGRVAIHLGDVEGTFFCPVLLGRQPELQPFMSLLHVRGRVRLAVSGRAAVKVTFNLSDGVFSTASPPHLRVHHEVDSLVSLTADF